jgi:hypothetical protein
MSTPPETRELAARLIAFESNAGESSEPMGSAALFVYMKLRQCISTFAGAAAFESLAFRALMQAQSEAPRLWAVQVTEDGSLEGLADLKSQIDDDMNLAGDEGTILIARLLGLLHIFLGESLTLSLLRDAWPGAAFDDRSSENGRTS